MQEMRLMNEWVAFNFPSAASFIHENASRLTLEINKIISAESGAIKRESTP